MTERAETSAANGARGYYGHPVVKPPVWTWEVGLYFFVGGLAGMSAVIALAALAAGEASLAVAALWLATLGALAGAGLLTWDLGRPSRFYLMLRVFRPSSPMSVGAWLLAAFGGAALLALVVVGGFGAGAFGVFTVVVAAVLGALVATYTGVLIGATVIPVWQHHRLTLPVQFGLAGLGSSAAVLELIGYRPPALYWIGLGVASIETVLALVDELRAHPIIDRPMREGLSGGLLRAAGVLSAVVVVLRLFEAVIPAALVFLVGALLRRYGWLFAGRASAEDPAAAFAIGDRMSPGAREG